MTEPFHYWGSDLNVSASGDLLLADGLELSKQAVLKRLLTNEAQYDTSGNCISPADYIWESEYGAGLPQRVGTLLNLPEITGLIRSQMSLEQYVAQTPEPVISVQQIPNGVAAQIYYTEAQSGQQVYLSFDTSGD